MFTVDDAMEHVVVAGAAGKMGSGITLLLAQAMAFSELQRYGGCGTGRYRLIAIDADEQGLFNLRRYLQEELLKAAERQINTLRQGYVENSALCSNEEMITAFVAGACDNVRCALTPYEAAGCRLLFEAIVEEIPAKKALLSQLRLQAAAGAICCSNTSSIPISLLNESSGWSKNLIGFHFYNPPALQRLVEIVIPDGSEELEPFAKGLAAKLNKKVVLSRDIPGFIGNGYLMRELSCACQLVERLRGHISQQQNPMPLAAAIYIVNRITEELLLRPMGIFQLADYVGLDICDKIAMTMRTYLHEESLQLPFVSKLVAQGVVGGHTAQGVQKEGFFCYNGGVPIAVRDPVGGEYLPLDGALRGECDAYLHGLPKSGISWKALQKDHAAKERIKEYFSALPSAEKDEGLCAAAVVQQFLKNLSHIADTLVQQKVVGDIADFDVVLKIGFGHLYGSQEFAR